MYNSFLFLKKTENGEGDRPDAASRPPFPSTSSSSAAAVANKGIAIISRFPNSKVRSFALRK